MFSATSENVPGGLWEACFSLGVLYENGIGIRQDLTAAFGLYRNACGEDEMIACTQCQKPYINRKALETIEAKLFGIESLQNTFSGNRQNILRMCPDCRAVTAMLEVDQGWEP